MPSAIHVLACAAVALLFWGIVGFAFSRRLVPHTLALPIAPALGWAIHSALALPVYRFLGFTTSTVAIGSLLTLVGASLLLRSTPPVDDRDSSVQVPVWSFVLAAFLAMAPAIALFPKISADAATLAPAIFDHSKVAMIDEMTRLGLPPGNPFFGEAGHEVLLAYYYLWHFSASELALILGVSGWEADIALTGFTAFSSLILLMGFATRIGKRASAAIWVLPLAFAASLRPVLALLFGEDAFHSIFLEGTGLGGWLFQATWAPQHVASTSCVLLCSFLIVQLARRPTPLAIVTLAVVAVAAYESSAWVGGIVLGIAAITIAVILIVDQPPNARMAFVASSMIAALLAVALAYPFLRDQLNNTLARDAGIPIVILPYPVFSEKISDHLRVVLDILGFWLAFLVIEFPAIYLPGIVSFVGTMRSASLSGPVRHTAKALLGLTLASLFVTAYLAITFTDNNDLGWRAVLPAIFVLTIFAAIGLSRWLASSRAAAAICLLLLALGLPDAFQLTAENVRGIPSGSDRDFFRTPAVWDAVRRHSAPSERVANNPFYMEQMTPWSINISWALLSNRRSCFTNRDLVLPLTSLPRARVEDINEQFRRVFAGQGNSEDVRDLAARYDCRVVLVTRQDGAWTRDPFADSRYYTLAEEKAGEWKIYRAAAGPSAATGRKPS